MLNLKCEQLILCKLPILHKLHKFSQFIHKFKIGIFWVLVLSCTFKFFPINKEIVRFLNVAPAGVQFLPSHEKD